MVVCAPLFLAAVVGAFVAVNPRSRPPVRRRSLEELSEGAIVAAQDEHGMWYNAQVLATSEDKYLVHYLGWEDYWDEWLETSRIARIPGAPKKPATEADLSPEAREAFRRKALEANDMWQFNHFSQTFEGAFEGTGERFDKTLASEASFAAALDLSRRDDVPDVEPETPHGVWAAVLDETRLPAGGLDFFQTLELRPIDFRGDNVRALDDDAAVLGGTAANVNAFTTARASPSELVCDVWLRKDAKLVALRVTYAATDDDWIFARADVARLSPRGTPPDPILPDLGTGIYDPHPLLNNGKPVHELFLPDKLTCAFPTRIDGAGVITLDWTIGTQRSQVDRVFERPDASLSSLEITDVLVPEDLDG
ncbi:hypothetical protein CTAYLR_008289 [Chrysophaeum taylorii]|uniref:Tudor-knot domain-containing protein n=1 Tax=Chrysophaeum taylorii TaxID=2483200 RepID=A0AAD7U8H8_9STRA|nr:hypothetical protein CTAYLR_008289 [Chrysophaeum taylorii]